MTITAAIREIGRYYRAGRISREELSVIHRGMMKYYLSLYRCLQAIEACTDPGGDCCAMDDDRMEATLEDLSRHRGELAEVLQGPLVWGRDKGV